MNDEAINSFKKLAVLQPKNEEAYYGLGSSYLELGNLKEAFNNTEIAFGLYDEKNLIIKPNMNTLMGRIYYEMKNYEEAIEYLERAQPLLKINPFADLYLGLCYYYMNPSDKEEAKSLLKSVPELREKIPQEVIEDLDL